VLVGSSKKASMGMSAAGNANLGHGVIYGSEIVQMTHPAYRNRAIKLIAGKCGLASRVDSFHESPTAEIGRVLKEQIVKSLTKVQEPPPAPQKKALPIPDDKPSTKRGGKRHRRMKEKYGLSDFRKQANRLKFGPDAEDEYGTNGKGFGMIGKSTGFGKLKLQVKQAKVQLPKRRQVMASTNSAGMSSSLAFTPIQGIELCNPDASRLRNQAFTEKYFSNAATFVHVERNSASQVPKTV